MNKKRIKRVETELGSMQDSMQRMEMGINDKLHHEGGNPHLMNHTLINMVLSVYRAK